jgi:hypothetical protein
MPTVGRAAKVLKVDGLVAALSGTVALSRPGVLGPVVIETDHGMR